MGLMNDCRFGGRITKDPELKKSSGGKEYVSFSLAVQKEYKDSKGEYGVDFLDFVAWSFSAKFIAKYIKKGEMLLVQSEASTNIYEKDGKQLKGHSYVVSRVQKISGGNQSDSQEPTKEVVKSIKKTAKKNASEDEMPF